MTMSDFHEFVFTMSQGGRVYVDGDRITFGEGDSERFVTMMVDDGGDETVSVSLDAYHLREMRLMLQHAERWVNKNYQDK